MRNLTKTLAVVSLLAPASAQPLGIGDLKLHSALNQKLNAEIDLLVTANENPSEIQVRLAPPEKFDEAGIPWNFFLSKIKFNTVVRPNGSVVVKLSSNEVLSEPFLDFLLEVSWTKGNLYREFTVLVDPPVAYEQPVTPVVETAPEPVKVTEATQPIIEQAEKQDVSAVQTAETEAIAVDSYGPTSKTDTLWTIAEKVRPSDDISIEQMMIAIHEKNPRAFYKDNVNALMSGKMLEIPDREAVVKLSKRQAAELFKQQAQAWKASTKPAVAEKSTEIAEETVSSQLELIAPVEAEVKDSVVVTPDQEQASEAIEADETAAAKTDIEETTVSEDQSAGQTENLALQARLEKLEQQLEMMQKLLVLKDEQLAALQNKQLIDQQAEPTKSVTPPQDKADAEPVKPVQQTKPAPTPEVKPVVKPKPKVKPAPAPVAEPETGFWEDAYYLVVGGLGVAILGGLGWLWWRKRKVEEQTDTESMFAASSEIKMPDSDVSGLAADDAAAYDVGTVGESSFLSEFTPSDFDAFDSDQNEVDPISEADVYLAYGRYQQAEELMRQAIAESPQRDDCKLKLLEIFYANENKEAFEEYTRELAGAGMQSNHSFWSKVLEMGSEIIPDSSVLKTGESSKANFDVEDADDAGLDTQESVEESDFQSESDIEKVSEVASFDEPSFASEEPMADVEDERNNEEMDFDLSSFSDAKSIQAEEDIREEAGAVDDMESIDFNFDVSTEVEKPQSDDAVETSDQVESIEFDFSSDSAKTESVVDEEATELKLDFEDDADSDLESFDFSSLGESAEEEPELAETSKDETAPVDSADEEFDFNFEFDDESLSGGDQPGEDELGVSDLTDMDEFETKIDLAKAYIDMGDSEAAKSIAEEVLEMGNDQQKQAAQEILEQLG